MYSFLSKLLADKKSGEIFTLFSVWHFIYIVIAVLTSVILLTVFKNKDVPAKKKLSKTLIDISFGLYLADFFLMPLAYGEIDIEKLPFHACTAMCVICFLSYRINFLEKYRTSFALLGFISNLVYLIYPAGVMWHAVHPISYRVIQTLVFHVLMSVYGFTVLVFEQNRFNIKKSYRDLIVLSLMVLWALLGNYAYNGTSGDYSHFFNWFFVVRDPFNMFPAQISPFIMPFLNIAIFFTAEIAIYLIISAIRHFKK